MKCSKIYRYTAVLTLDLRKNSGPTPADDMAPQTITDCGKFTLDLKQRGFCASPLFLQTLGPWFPKEMQHLLSSENITLDHSPVLFVFSPDETLLTMSVVQEWLDTRNATAETHVLHTSVRVVLEALTPAAVHSLWISPTFFNGFCFTILSRVRLSLLLVHFFLPHLFLPFASLLMCLDTEHCEQPASFAMTFCVLPSLCKVSMVVFWTTVKSAVFPMTV